MTRLASAAKRVLYCRGGADRPVEKRAGQEEEKMRNILTKLNLLQFSLEKKLARLEQIKVYTRLQTAEARDPKLVSEEIWTQKQAEIEEIKKLDQGFGTLSAELMPHLREDPGRYSESIARMQELIERIVTMESEIRQAEKKNYAEAMLTFVKKGVKENRPRPQAAGIKKYKQAEKDFKQAEKNFSPTNKNFQEQ